MATVTVSGVVKDETGRKDSRDWKAFSPVYREGSDGEVVTMRKQQVRVVAGIFTAKLDPGVCVIENPDGQRYTVTIPDEDADLWDIIAAAVAFPPNTEAELLADAVSGYLEDNPPVADWDVLTSKPTVIGAGATQAAARSAIGAASTTAVATAQSTADTAISRLNTPTVLSNFKLSNTAKLRASLSKAQLGTGYSTHVVIGDSLSSAFTGAAFDFPNSWWRKLWRSMVASGVPSAGTGRVAISDGTAAPTNSIDPRIVLVGSWTHVSTWLGSPATGGTVTFNSDAAGTIVDVYYLVQNSVPFTVTIDGGVPQTVTPVGGWHREKATFTGLPNTTHVVTVTAAAGDANSVILLGFQVRQGSGLRFDNWGVKFGITAEFWQNDPDDLGPGKITADYSSDADVIHVALGSNDIVDGSGPAAAATAIESIRGRFPSADCILYIEPDTDGDSDYAAYVTAMRALSVTLDVPLVDLSLRQGTRAQITAAGMFGADGVHLNTVGQADWGTVALEGIRSVAPVLGTTGNAMAPVEMVSVTAASYTARLVDRVIRVNRAGAVAITMPATNSGNAAAIPRPGAGAIVTVKDISGAAATNNITITAAGGETIDGASSKTVSTNYGYITLVSTGTGWNVIGAG